MPASRGRPLRRRPARFDERYEVLAGTLETAEVILTSWPQAPTLTVPSA